MTDDRDNHPGRRGKPYGKRATDYYNDASTRVPDPADLGRLHDIIAHHAREEDDEKQERLDAAQDARDRRQFKRNAALALFLAAMVNNPSVLVRALWEWITAHVSIR